VKVETLENSHTPLWRGMAPILAGLAFGLAPMLAVAQDEPQTDEQEAEDAPDVERMTVTGSRLQTNANVVAPNPVLSVGQEEIDARGTTRIEDLTNQLPQVFAGQGAEVANGATGTATLNLRGLGSIRTLTLIDGKRLPFGDSSTAPPNLDVIPTRLVERVEIVTGGASAVYGSDAVAGVANFILKDDYEGLEIDIQGGFHQAGNDNGLMEGVLAAANQPIPGSTTDGRELQASVTMGANTFDGRGNVTMFINYENLNAISQGDRVESGCAIGADDSEFSFRGIGCIGSGNFRLMGGPGGNFFQQADGEIVPFVESPETTFNFGPDNFFQRPIERFQIYSKGKYDLTDDVEMFMDLSFTNVNSDAQIAPSASFGIGAFSINCDNPFIQPDANPGIPLTEIFGCPEPGASTDVSGITASHRNVEGDPRSTELDNTTWRTLGGLRGTLFEHYDFEVFGQFSRTQDKNISTNDLLIDNVQDSFFVVEGPDGNPVCRSGNPDCVPWNIFQRGPNGESLVSAEAADFVTGVGITTGTTQQQVFGGNIQTNLERFGFVSPFADSGMGILFGWEYRKDELDAQPDQISQRADGGFTGVGGPTVPTQGEVKVAEGFMEAQLPLVSGVQFMEQLAVGGAYRFSDYEVEGGEGNASNSFDTDTWHVFLNWSPTDDLRLRGQFQRAVRAPNVIELFTPLGTGLPDLTEGPGGLFDPCASSDPSATFEQCARTGVTEEQFGNILDVISGQTQSILSGNPNLQPEESDTITIGAIFTPGFIDGLTISVDYFDIEVEDAIQAGIPAPTTLRECLQTGDPLFCDLIQRDSQGSLNSGQPGVGFDQTNINIAELATSGLDFQVVYDLDLWDVGLDGMGSVRFDYASTYLDELSTTPAPGVAPIECEGKVLGSCGTPNPEYRHRMLTTWQTPWDVNVTATWRYFSSTTNAEGRDSASAFIDREIDRVQYLDLSLEYNWSENLMFRAGVNNVNAADIPISTSVGTGAGNGNTFPTVFDATGRFFFFGARYTL